MVKGFILLVIHGLHLQSLWDSDRRFPDSISNLVVESSQGRRLATYVFLFDAREHALHVNLTS